MALREINLISADILLSRYRVRHVLFWTGFLILILFLVGGLFIYQTTFIMDRNHTGKNLEDIYALLGTKTEELNRVQVELEKLAQQQSMLGDIKKNQPYSLVLLRLADIMNEDTWLIGLSIDSMVQNSKEWEEEIVITGYSSSNETLGGFINRLSDTPMFKDVLLKYARETRQVMLDRNENQNVRLLEFQLQCKMYK